MDFFKRRKPLKEPEQAIHERREQKKRGARADEEYYKAMRIIAMESGDARGMRFYERRAADLQALRYELESMGDGTGDSDAD